MTDLKNLEKDNIFTDDESADLTVEVTNLFDIAEKINFASIQEMMQSIQVQIVTNFPKLKLPL